MKKKIPLVCKKAWERDIVKHRNDYLGGRSICIYDAFERDSLQITFLF